MAGAPMASRTVDKKNEFARQIFSGLPRHYDLLAEMLSLGQNGRWRRAMVDQVVAANPATILDVATGTAGVALDLARRTQATITGIDLTEAMLQRAREKVTAQGYTRRISLLAGRAEALPFPDAAFDALTFTYLLRYVADPASTLRELVRVLKPGGLMASLEFSVPPNPFWHACWWLYTRLALPAAGRLVSPEWFRVGRFLGPNISQHYRRYPLPWTVQAWQDAGMVGVRARVMSLGGGVVMWGRKPDG
jgi:demethylmenaquinone methyltransferase / 2-methoxy-6-polyprenyl-1,4-benzoquinol methylase